MTDSTCLDFDLQIEHAEQGYRIQMHRKENTMAPKGNRAMLGAISSEFPDVDTVCLAAA
jgi:hypothetical protein